MRARRRLVFAAVCVAVLGFGLTLGASAHDGYDGAPPDPEATEEPHSYVVDGHTPEEEAAREAAEAARIQAEAQAAGVPIPDSYTFRVPGHTHEEEAARLQGQAGDEPADDHIVHAYTISAHGPEEAPTDIPSYVPPVTEWGAPPPVGGTVIVTTGNCPGGTHVDQCVDHDGTAYNICYGAPTDSE